MAEEMTFNGVRGTVTLTLDEPYTGTQETQPPEKRTITVNSAIPSDPIFAGPTITSLMDAVSRLDRLVVQLEGGRERYAADPEAVHDFPAELIGEGRLALNVLKKVTSGHVSARLDAANRSGANLSRELDESRKLAEGRRESLMSAVSQRDAIGRRCAELEALSSTASGMRNEAALLLDVSEKRASALVLDLEESERNADLGMGLLRQDNEGLRKRVEELEARLKDEVAKVKGLEATERAFTRRVAELAGDRKGALEAQAKAENRLEKRRQVSHGLTEEVEDLHRDVDTLKMQRTRLQGVLDERIASGDALAANLEAMGLELQRALARLVDAERTLGQLLPVVDAIQGAREYLGDFDCPEAGCYASRAEEGDDHGSDCYLGAILTAFEARQVAQ